MNIDFRLNKNGQYGGILMIFCFDNQEEAEDYMNNLECLTVFLEKGEKTQLLTLKDKLVKRLSDKYKSEDFAISSILFSKEACDFIWILQQIGFRAYLLGYGDK